MATLQEQVEIIRAGSPYLPYPAAIDRLGEKLDDVLDQVNRAQDLGAYDLAADLSDQAQALQSEYWGAINSYIIDPAAFDQDQAAADEAADQAAYRIGG